MDTSEHRNDPDDLFVESSDLPKVDGPLGLALTGSVVELISADVADELRGEDRRCAMAYRRTGRAILTGAM